MFFHNQVRTLGDYNTKCIDHFQVSGKQASLRSTLPGARYQRASQKPFWGRYNIRMAKKLIPIYATSGDLGAYLLYPNLYNPMGEWVGYVKPNREVYSVLGNYVGELTNDPRILRRRSYDFSKPRLDPPPPQARITVPATVPLAPMMAELPFTMIDILEDEPERLSTVDFDELREDMD